MTGMWMAETTVPGHEFAKKLARTLVEMRLAASIHIVPVDSICRWDGKVVSSAEYRLSIKTVEERLEALEAAIREHHPYKVFAFLAHFVPRISDDYAAWLEGATEPD